MPQLLEGIVRNYDWGDERAIADLQGRPPSGEPEAELWFGAHRSAPSGLVGDDRTLDQVVAADPSRTLGDDVAGRFGELPFLVKVLAAAEPLSIQAHPSAEQARAGFDREEAAGLPIDAARRVYRDPHHKPELLCALTEFRALCGFRRIDETRELFEALGQGVEEIEERLAIRGEEAGVLADLVGWLLREAPVEIVRSCVEACRLLDRPGFGDEAQIALDAATHHPDDPGIVVTLLLNRVVLRPGEAVFLGAGNLHAYLSGVGVEVMSSSDNVVRGGLTTKHVDVDELLEVVDCTPSVPSAQRPDDWNHRYDVEAAEFALHRFDLRSGRSITWDRHAPAIALVTKGEAAVGDVTVGRGRAAFVAAAEQARLVGDAEVFVATTPA